MEQLHQGCTNPSRQEAVATKLCAVASNICESSELNFIRVTVMAPRILS